MFERHLQIKFYIYQWRPVEEQLRQFRFLVDVGAISVAFQTLIYHLNRAAVEWFVERRAPAPPPSVDYLSAFDRLYVAIESASRSSHGVAELKDALDSFLEVVERELVRPLVEQGLSERDPIRRSLMLAAANITRGMQHTSELVVRAQARLAPAEGGASSVASSRANPLLNNINALVAVCKGLR
jgi:hypothetical protein